MLRLALASLPRILPEPDRDPLAVLRGGIEQQLFDGNRGEGLRGFHPRLAVSPPAAETDGLRDSPLEGTGFELVWGLSCQVVFFRFIASSWFGAGSGRSSSRRLRSGSRSARNGSRDRNASKAWRLVA